MKNIFLIGFMGTGKSTVARYMNREFGMDIVEMDELIAEREGKSIPDIFAEHGEEYFRNLETELLREIQRKENVVVSCGGGVAMREANVQEMKKNGCVVLLSADPSTILKRVEKDDNRPLLKGKKNVEAIRELMESRRGKYELAADLEVSVDEKSAEEICAEIMNKIKESDK